MILTSPLWHALGVIYQLLFSHIEKYTLQWRLNRVGLFIPLETAGASVTAVTNDVVCTDIDV